MLPKKSIPPLPPKRPPPQFLLRNVKISDENAQVLLKIRLKRLYLKKVIDNRIDTDRRTYELVYRFFKNNRLLKAVKSLQIPVIRQLYAYETLKSSKNLKKFSINADDEDTNLAKIAFYLKRLPPDVQTITLYLSRFDDIIPKDLYNIAKSLRRLRKLQYFYRCYFLENNINKTYITKELHTYSKSVSRLKNLDKVVYIVGRDEQPGFQRAMRRDIKYPGITELQMRLSASQLPYYNRMARYFDPDESCNVDPPSYFDNMTEVKEYIYQVVLDEVRHDDAEKNDDLNFGHLPIPKSCSKIPKEIDFDPNDNDDVASEAGTVASYSAEDERKFKINERFLIECMLRAEMSPFYRFHLFPNLKKLTILQEDHLYPLGSFAQEGLAALKKLESLKINILRRSVGSTYLFKGFLQLPSLKKFSLHITFIKDEDWVLLKQFLEIQNNLESFSIWIRCEPGSKARYLKQNIYFEEAVKCLDNKKLLKSLDLRSDFLSLETLSKALGNLSMTNQLSSLRLEGSDDTVISEQKLWKRVEGLCKFIKNQKESLRKLYVSLLFVLEDNVVTHIGEAISKLTGLRRLEIGLNFAVKEKMNSFQTFFENTLQEDISVESRKKLTISKIWNLNLAKYLKRLDNLEDFMLTFDVLNPNEKGSAKWFVDVMNVLPTLEKLRKVQIWAHDGGAVKDYEAKIVKAMLEMKNIKEIDMNFFDDSGYFMRNYWWIERVVSHVNKRQAMISDLMF